MDVIETGGGMMECTDVAQCMDKWQDVVNVVMNI
jgi:hypothetical protein